MAARENGRNDPLGGYKHRQLGKVIGSSNRARQRRQHVRIAMVDTEISQRDDRNCQHRRDSQRSLANEGRPNDPTERAPPSGLSELYN